MATRSQLRRAARKAPRKLTRISKEEWPPGTAHAGVGVLVDVWHSQALTVFVQKGDHPDVLARISVRAMSRAAHRTGLNWDALQKIKAQVGYGDRFAVEAFPEDQHVQDGAPMRHLWVLRESPAWAWRTA